MRSLLDDLRYTVRSLLRQRSLLILATVTLGIGMGATATMFGIVDQLLVRSPALVRQPEAIKRIYYNDIDSKGASNVGPVTTYPVIPALREHAPAFSEIASFAFSATYSMGSGSDARSVTIRGVSGNYFRMLGVAPARGRSFIDDDDVAPDGRRVVILSWGFWTREMGGDTTIIGREIQLQGKTYTVIGINPLAFTDLERETIDIYLPVSTYTTDIFGTRSWHTTAASTWLRLLGRIRHGTTPVVAASQATAAYRGVLREWTNSRRDASSFVVLSPISSSISPNGLRAESKVSLWLMGVSAIVLLIACANVANLLLARSVDRRQEIAIRMALGVGRARLLRLVLMEGVVLAALATVVAVTIAVGGGRAVQAYLLPSSAWSASPMDARVLVFSIGAMLLCVLLAGLAPALHGARTDVVEGLKANERVGSRGGARLRQALIVFQAALSVVLLVGSGLFVKSLSNVVARDIGIARDQVIRVNMPLRRFGFDTTQILDVFRRGTERLAAMNGVRGTTVVRLTTPMGAAMAARFSVPGVDKPQLPLGGPYTSVVTSGFFNTLGARIVRGRAFSGEEDRVPSRVAIVNEPLARAYWPDKDPIGQCVLLNEDEVCSHVVGVVQPIMQFSALNDERALVYAPASHPAFSDELPRSLLVRVSGDGPRMVANVQRELQSLAPNMPFIQASTYGELLAPQLQHRRMGATMFSLFGVIALLISAVGLYSALAYWVAQRRQEIGLRMALGAQRHDVVRLVAIQAYGAVGIGLVIGVVAAALASRWVADQLYEVGPRDPAVYGTAVAILLLATAAAAFWPAWRSSLIDPARALKSQ